MRVLLQRVSDASVTVDDTVTGRTEGGLMILLCAMRDDTHAVADQMAAKIAKLRIFADDNGKSNLSVKDIGGSALVVSQFTLSADWKKGNRPSYTKAAEPALAEELYDYFCDRLIHEGVPTQKGVFAASMAVTLTNDGPFTIWMDSNE